MALGLLLEHQPTWVATFYDPSPLATSATYKKQLLRIRQCEWEMRGAYQSRLSFFLQGAASLLRRTHALVTHDGVHRVIMGLIGKMRQELGRKRDANPRG